MIKLMLSIYATFKHRSLRLEIIKKRTDKYKSYSKVVLNSFPYLQPGVLKDLLFTLRGCVRSLAFCGSVRPKKVQLFWTEIISPMTISLDDLGPNLGRAVKITKINILGWTWAGKHFSGSKIYA